MVGPLLGDDHFLNLSNSIYGALFYSTLILLGKETEEVYTGVALINWGPQPVWAEKN